MCHANVLCLLGSRDYYRLSLSLLGYRTASVIIALTDGELRENEFDLAAREVRPYTLDPAIFSILSPPSIKKSI